MTSPASPAAEEILLCEPNISEGRDPGRIQAFRRVVEETPGVRLLHASADPDHHRMVLAYVGGPADVVAATDRLAERVFAVVDLREHRGQHPRLGALDVVPFVALGGTPREAALDACRCFGARVGERGVPVYYYEEAATRPERRALPRVRAGGFEGLPRRMADPAWAPDEGPPLPHPTAGAVVVGVRQPLVRFNVNLGTGDVAVAKAIAAGIRESGGGLPGVRALGLELASRGLTQVSMNLTDYHRTPPAVVYRRVRADAARHGIPVVGTEIIGPVPAAALEGLPEELRRGVPSDQILETEA